MINRDMHNYLYKITNLINSKIYIGVHKTADLNDGYMGSGKRIRYAIQKYGIENFKKEILEFFDTFEDALLKESVIVNWDFLDNKNVYNLKPGGRGGFPREAALRGSKKGARASGDRARALFESGDTEYTERMTKQQINASKRYKELYAEHGGIWWTSGFKDKKHSEETLVKMRGKRPQSSGSKNSQYGKCWITKDKQNMLIHKEHLPEYTKDGWITGRVTKFGQVAQLVETRKI